MRLCNNHDRLSLNCKIKLKENEQGKQNKLDNTSREDQSTKLKVVEDGRFSLKIQTLPSSVCTTLMYSEHI